MFEPTFMRKAKKTRAQNALPPAARIYSL